MEIVYRAPQKSRCEERALVLVASGLECQVIQAGGECLLVIDADHADQARRELGDYDTENPPATRHPTLRPVIQGLPGALVYGFVLLIVDGLARWEAFGIDWLRAGSAAAGLIQQGQWWRCLTALTLHADAAHLLGNLAFGSLFALLASQVWGPGAAWLAIVGAGTLGNAVNGALYGPGHVSVGASTAVFATWGMLTVHALWHRRQDPSTRVRRWAPLAGGLALLAFLGTAGERTDVLAHLAGFLAGCLIGAFMIQVPAALIALRRTQIAAAAACLVAVILAWGVALAN